MARPWFKLDATDWLGDLKLRDISPAARGVWIDILCLMHQSEERGVLITNGEPWDFNKVVKRVANGSRACRQACRELVAKEVMSVRQDGAFFSKRMVNDEKQMQTDKDNGAKGGNPELSKGVNPPDKARTKSKEQRINNPIVPFEIPDALKPAEAQIREWIAYKAERGERYKPKGLQSLLAKLAGWGPEKTIAAIRDSMAANYAGLFEPRAGPGTLFRDSKPNPAHAKVNHEQPNIPKISLKEFAASCSDSCPGSNARRDPDRSDGNP